MKFFDAVSEMNSLRGYGYSPIAIEVHKDTVRECIVFKNEKEFNYWDIKYYSQDTLIFIRVSFK